MRFDLVTHGNLWVFVPLNDAAREWMGEYSEQKSVLITESGQLADATINSIWECGGEFAD